MILSKRDLCGGPALTASILVFDGTLYVCRYGDYPYSCAKELINGERGSDRIWELPNLDGRDAVDCYESGLL